MQRLRLKFCRSEEIKFISHLDIVRLWERAIRRAGVPLVYSQGFSPHPQLSLAAPLTVGMTGEAELMDIFTIRNVSPHWVTDALNQQLPPGIKVTDAYPANPNEPSLQSLLRAAEYRVDIATDKSEAEIKSAIENLLALTDLPWQHVRDTGVRHYNLRALVIDIRFVSLEAGKCVLAMKLRSDSNGSGRPEQVSSALGFAERPLVIHRTNLIMETPGASAR